MRVLVVEDEPDLASAIAISLRREGYAVDVAGDGASALDRVGVNEYDLVCLDLNLPDTDGLEVCRQVVSMPTADDAVVPRIIMLTARGGIDDRISGLDQGADDYLVKPFSLGELGLGSVPCSAATRPRPARSCAAPASSSTAAGTRCG